MVTLAKRDFLVRYKQAVLGVAWAVVTPVVLVTLFALVFHRVANVDTGGVPYPLFAYVGLLPWTFFSTPLSPPADEPRSTTPLLNKVYVPARCSRLVAGGRVDR